jgi:PAS domain S-box-containing protein
MHDIIVRKAAEKQLAQMEGRYHGLLEAAPDAMVVINHEGAIVLLNLQAEKQFGYRRDELVGQKVKTIIPEGFAERLIADGTRTAAEALAQQIGTGIELIARRKDGSEFPIELMLSPLESPEGILVTAAIRDISVRKAAEQHLAQVEGRYRGLLEAAPDAMVVVNQGGDIVLLNLQAEKQFGYRRDELIGQQVKNIIPQGFAERLIADDLRSAEEAVAQQIGTGIELTARRKDGSEFPIELMLSPLESPEGILVTAAIRDISVRVSTEEQLRQAQKMEAIGNLTGGMAHDFNNMLGVILGNLDLARPLVKDNDEVVELVQEAIEAALSGAELTRRLLAFARQQPLRPERIAANELIAGIVRLLRRTLGENIEITLDLADNLWPAVADPAQLEASLTNLATNARDAMPQGGKLTIATANRHLDRDYAAAHVEAIPGEYAAIEVTDTGAGMPPGVVERIFEPFFTTKGPGKGTGLGLSMVFGFIKQSGGHISVYSEPGVGTTFRLYLPRAAAEGTVAVDTDAVAAPSGKGEIVLAVEDNPRLRRLVMRQLTELGYQPLEADGPAAALSLLEAGKVELLFSDIVMPGPIDGIGLAQQASERWPDLKIVLTSGFPGTKLDDQLGLTRAVVRLLGKPYRKEDLARVLNEALGG